MQPEATTNHPTIVLASGNQHKYKELAALPGSGFELKLQSEFGIEGPEETGRTFVENALIKARHACELTGLPALADDSGLCVAALGQAPGVLSARFAGQECAGQDATDAANNDKLMTLLAGSTNRQASFHCVLVLLQSPDDAAPIIAEGVWQGEIATRARGRQGFGYDPLFYLPQLGKTAAQLSPAAKNACSHRALALVRLREKLRLR